MLNLLLIMKKLLSKVIFVIFIFIFFLNTKETFAYSVNFPHGLTKNDVAQSTNGFTLFAPLNDYEQQNGDVFLIDMNGKIVHSWELNFIPGPYAKLMKDGTLVYAGVTFRLQAPPSNGGGGIIQKVDWNGNVLWGYENKNLHHDFSIMPNGNILALLWYPMDQRNQDRVKFSDLSLKKDGDVWSDTVIEIDGNTGQVIWSWRVEEHLNIENFKILPTVNQNELTHSNSIQYLPKGNSFDGEEGFIISFRNIGTIAIVHKDVGDIVWHFSDLEAQHDARLLENGHILVFNNGLSVGIQSSKVLEIDPKSDKIVWEYSGDGIINQHFFSPLMGGAQRLSSGNTLITEATAGRVFEVKENGDIVWEYVSPYFSKISNDNSIFKAVRYSKDEIDWPVKMPNSEPLLPIYLAKNSENISKFKDYFLLILMCLLIITFSKKSNHKFKFGRKKKKLKKLKIDRFINYE